MEGAVHLCVALIDSGTWEDLVRSIERSSSALFAMKLAVEAVNVYLPNTANDQWQYLRDRAAALAEKAASSRTI